MVERCRKFDVNNSALYTAGYTGPNSWRPESARKHQKTKPAAVELPWFFSWFMMQTCLSQGRSHPSTLEATSEKKNIVFFWMVTEVLTITLVNSTLILTHSQNIPPKSPQVRYFAWRTRDIELKCCQCYLHGSSLRFGNFDQPILGLLLFED